METLFDLEMMPAILILWIVLAATRIIVRIESWLRPLNTPEEIQLEDARERARIWSGRMVLITNIRNLENGLRMVRFIPAGSGQDNIEFYLSAGHPDYSLFDTPPCRLWLSCSQRPLDREQRSASGTFARFIPAC